jgi:hypothetical protein
MSCRRHLPEPEEGYRVLDDPADAWQQVDRRMSLAREWDELVDQVRQLDGFEDFLRPPRLEALLPAAANGPVVIVNVSRWRCDALIVTTDGVEVCALTELTSADVEQRALDYLKVLQDAENATAKLVEARDRFDGGDNSPEAFRDYAAARTAFAQAQQNVESGLASVAEWMWDRIAEPVLDLLTIKDVPSAGELPPRLWWCPTGLLSLLPLHAAGYHRTSDTPPRTVLDRVVSSYTPTLRALAEAQSERTTDVDERLLVVALPETPGQVPLQAVTTETDLLTGLFLDQHTLLEGDRATWEAVRTELGRHTWVHLSCHGTQNLTDPSQGGLLLHDRMFTIADVSAGQYHGEFAFLSACKTATGGVTLADEVITLAAAMHYTGYRHVIGTLWSVFDTSAAEIARIVYTELVADGRFTPARSAHALHKAVKRLRDLDRDRLSAWMPFTHTGP